jgi:hypothetical protein
MFDPRICPWFLWLIFWDVFCVKQTMKELQRACTALSQENGKLEVSGTIVMFESFPFPIHMWHLGLG